jgi:biopolymer transport protein ExbD
MPKVKVAKKDLWIDMTPMCDMAFLLLDFFIMTSSFTAQEPVQVSTPSSVSEIKIPETNIMTVLIDKDGKVFFGIDGQDNRKDLLRKMGELNGIEFTDKELKTFSVLNLTGVPMNLMKPFLDLPKEQRDNPANNPGIPSDDSTNNEFKQWVSAARAINMKAKIAIKSDRSTPYKVIKNIMGTMQNLQENRYNLITSLEMSPDK